MMCTDQCDEGHSCVCEPFYVRSADGECILLSECTGDVTESVTDTSTLETCCQNETYSECRFCESSCENPTPICSLQCRPGCFCAEGLVRDQDGDCVLPEDCSVQPSCPKNENYKSCGSCQPTCDNPNPKCTKNCRQGCYCNEGLIRDTKGDCVSSEKCSTGCTGLLSCLIQFVVDIVNSLLNFVKRIFEWILKSD